MSGYTAFSVVVRQVWRGPTPFRWEIFRGETAQPIHVSAGGYRTKEEAGRAGRAMLAQLELSRQSAGRRAWNGPQIEGIAIRW